MVHQNRRAGSVKARPFPSALARQGVRPRAAESHDAADLFAETHRARQVNVGLCSATSVESIGMGGLRRFKATEQVDAGEVVCDDAMT